MHLKGGPRNQRAGCVEAGWLRRARTSRGSAFDAAVMQLDGIRPGDTGAVADKFHKGETNNDGNKQRKNGNH